MIDIHDYLEKPQSERQAHLKLYEPCLERGGFSTYFKGLLAHILDTTIPSGKKIHVCHACHNGLCSNPNHLYWGSAAENRVDAVANGAPASPHAAMIKKYGIAKVSEMNRRTPEQASKAGKGNIGTTKSEEHRRKISEAIKAKHAAKRLILPE